MPKRPPWTVDMSKDELDRHEQAAFSAFIDKIHERYPGETLANFEHNLETWRQLWRVVELSDVIFLICDIRYAPLHCPPALCKFVLRDMGRRMVLVLNKVRPVLCGGGGGCWCWCV
eukprot:m.117333 g.117333  ORF g.117333 m.117333 type:complete len:116 (-) comp9204_c1_seq8:26-373(-)